MIISQFLSDCLERKPGSFRDFVVCTVDDIYARTGGRLNQTLDVYGLLYERLDWAPQGAQFSAWLDQVVGPRAPDIPSPDRELVERIVEATGPELKPVAKPGLPERLTLLANSGFLIWLPLALLGAHFLSADRLSALATGLTLTLSFYPLHGLFAARWFRSRWSFLAVPFISTSMLYATAFGCAVLKGLNMEERSLLDFLKGLDVQLQELSKEEFLLFTVLCALLWSFARFLVMRRKWIVVKRTHPLTLGFPLLVFGSLMVPLALFLPYPVLSDEVRERTYEALNRPSGESERCCWAHEPGPLQFAFLGGHFIEKPDNTERLEFWLELGEEAFQDKDWSNSEVYRENLDFFRLDLSGTDFGSEPLLARGETFGLVHTEVALRLIQSPRPLTLADLRTIVFEVAAMPGSEPERLRHLRQLSLRSLPFVALAPKDWDTQVNDLLYDENQADLFGEESIENYKPDSIWPVRRFPLSRTYARAHKTWKREKKLRQFVLEARPLSLDVQRRMQDDSFSRSGPVSRRLCQEERRRVLHFLALELYLKELRCESESLPFGLEDFPPDLQRSIEALDGTLLYESGHLNYNSPFEP